MILGKQNSLLIPSTDWAHGKWSRAVVGIFAIAFSLIGQVLAQSAVQSAPDFKGSGGHAQRSGVRVPFTPGPFGPDGKVKRVTPVKAASVPNETETLQVEQSRALADAGILTPTTKKPSSSLTASQLSLLHWNPNSLNPAENPMISSDWLKKPVEHPVKPLKSNSSSVPVAGPSFAGIGYDGFIPPDGGVAAGSLQVVEVVNSTINVYDKNGNLLSSQTLANFFSFLGVPAQDFIFDPSILYDMQTGRFWILAVSENDAPNRSNLLVAVSAADDVTQGWFEYWMDATVDGGGGTNNWCDYPHMGIDADALYMSCNQFAFPRVGPAAGSFQYAKIRIMNKDEFMNATCCSWWDYTNLSDSGGTSFTIRPAIERFTGHGFGDYWVNTVGAGGSGSAVKVWQLTNPTGCCDGSGGPSLTGNEQSVGSYGVPPKGQQPNFVQAIETDDTRVLFAFYQFGLLSYGHNLACTQGGTTSDACAGFTEINVSSYPTMTNLNDWYYSQPAGEDVYFPFVDVNINGDKTMVYTRSDASSTFPGAYYTTIPSSATCTFCTGGETTMQAGVANYVNTGGGAKNRWGDYQGASTDPDLIGIWVEGQYVSSPNAWSTDIESSYRSYFPVDTPSPSPLNFPDTAVYSTSAQEVVNFTNTGNAALITGTARTSGLNPDFSITSSTCGVTLQPGQSCTVGVTFAPTFIGNETELLFLPDNTGEASVILSGNSVPANTTTAIGASPNPSTYGQNVSMFAVVLSSTSGTPAGSVTFADGATTLGTVALSSGGASFNTSSLNAGVHTLGATYSGSSFFNGSSNSLTLTVNQAATSATVSSSLNPSTFGTAVTFTAHVTSGGGVPTGTVTFLDGATSLGTGTLSAGTASLTTAALTGGSHSIFVAYSGSANFAASKSAGLVQTVNKVATSVSLASSVNPSQFRQAVAFTAKVTSSVGVPAGTVTFKHGATILGTATLAAGTATFTTTGLAVGSLVITATYSGSSNYLASTSPSLTQTVHKASTATTVTSSKNPSTHGTAVTFTATVKLAFGGVATGAVTFKNGTAILGTGTLNASNKATFMTSTLSVGTHSITAVYPGDVHSTASTSAVLKQVVQ